MEFAHTAIGDTPGRARNPIESTTHGAFRALPPRDQTTFPSPENRRHAVSRFVSLLEGWVNILDGFK
jgi:hypothetical protein